MKIQKIIRKVHTTLEKRATRKHNQMVNRYCRVEDFSIPTDTYNTIYPAREGIARYAKRKGVSVEIINANEDYLLKHNNVSEETELGKIILTVKNIISDKTTNRILSADTQANYPNREMHTNDNFLRHLYRTIETCTKEVTGKTK